MPTRLSDRLGVIAAWGCGLMLAAALFVLLAWICFNGLAAISWSFLTTSPVAGTLDNTMQGGILAPVVGTLVICLVGLVLAVPFGVATAVFLTEYRKPATLARLVDTAVDLIFGVPSVVFALFGIAIFTLPMMTALSSGVSGSSKATGQSFLTAGMMMALIAYPPIVRATESAIRSVPDRLREGAYALGKTRSTTVRKVVLPGARQGITTGAILGLGRIAGDTAIVWLLLGGTIFQPLPGGWWQPQNWLAFLRGQGSTLTTYVYYASPAGEGNSESAAYGAVLVLMVLILLITTTLRIVTRRRATS